MRVRHRASIQHAKHLQPENGLVPWNGMPQHLQVMGVLCGLVRDGYAVEDGDESVGV